MGGNPRRNPFGTLRVTLASPLPSGRASRRVGVPDRPAAGDAATSVQPTEGLEAAASGGRLANLVSVTPTVYECRDLETEPFSGCALLRGACPQTRVGGRGPWEWRRETQTAKE